MKNKQTEEKYAQQDFIQLRSYLLSSREEDYVVGTMEFICTLSPPFDHTQSKYW